MVAVRILTPGDIEQQPIETYYLQQRHMASPEDFGSQIGQAAQHFGSVLASLSNSLASRRQGVEDAIGAKRIEMGMNDYYSNSLTEAQQKAPGGAQGFHQDLWGQWEKEAPQKLADLQKQYSLSPRAAQEMQLHDLELRQHYGSQAVTFENNERVRQLTQDTSKTIDDLQSQAGAHGDFANVQKQINDTITSASPLLTPEQEQKTKDYVKSRWFGSRGNPGVIQQYADSLVGTGFAGTTGDQAKADMQAKFKMFGDQVDALDLTDGEKASVKQAIGDDWARKFYQQAKEQFPDQLPRSPPPSQLPSSQQSAPSDGKAASLIRQFEGFKATPYHDVNRSRVGYGSDTVTAPDGTVQNVKPGMVVTKADADRDLTRRVDEFQKGIIGKVGQAAWDKLNPDQQAALTSTAYNYGELPDRVVGAVKSGDAQEMSQAVARLGIDNNGINRERRAQEAAILSGRQAVPAGGESGIRQTMASPPTDGVFSHMTQDTWLGAQRDAQQADRNIIAQQRLYSAEEKNRLDLGIETGRITQDNQILNNPNIDDGDKAGLLRQLYAKNKEQMAQSAAVQEYVSGTGTYNPFDEGTKKRVDLIDKAVTTASPNLTDEQHGAVWRDIADKTGSVPSGAVNWLRQQTASGDPAKAAAAYSLADDIQNRAPQALTSRDGGKDLADQATVYRHMVNDLGYDPQHAAQLIQAQRDEGQKRDAKVLESKADEISKTFTPADVASVFSTTRVYNPFSYGGTPQAGFTDAQGQLMVNDYRELFRNRMVETGNTDSAKALAQADLKKIYGVSHVSGTDTLMRYPPENFAPLVAGSNDYLRKSVLDDARKASGNPDLKEGDAFLWYNDNTAAQARLAAQGRGGPPSYALYYATDENGQKVWHRAQQDYVLNVGDVRKAQDEIEMSVQETRAQHSDLKAQVGIPELSGGANTFNPTGGKSGLFDEPAQSPRTAQPSATAGTGVSGGTEAAGAPPARPGTLDSLRGGTVPEITYPQDSVTIPGAVAPRKGKSAPRPGSLKTLKIEQ